MPLTKKGKEIMKSMKEQYGKKKGESIFYASKNKGTIKGVEKMKAGNMANLKPVPADKEKSLGQLPEDVRNKMGYAKKGKIMKASMGKSVRGYGAARTSGMGLEDQELPPGKSLDYYKDLM